MASSSQSPPGTNTVQPYRMHVSQKYLDLTKQKLQLTRLPRDPRNTQQKLDFGVTKSDLEPLIDHWLENYDWRAQESFYNDTLPQFRVPINGTRLHFVHKRAQSPTAIPLLFVHGWPESFIGVSKIIDALTNPIATPPRGDENVQAFHVVAPSIPGFGFSDPIPEAANNFQATAEVFDVLMKGLGYYQYILHGSGWGFKICRVIALTHPESCIGIHTVNPEVPSPRFGTLPWVKYRIAKLTFAIFRRSTFGYSPGELMFSGASLDPLQMSPGMTPPATPGGSQPVSERPQTVAYALCDSPSGLLAYILDAIKPTYIDSPPSSTGSRSPESLRLPGPGAGRSPVSPQSYGTPQGRSPRSPGSASHSPQYLEMANLGSPWTSTGLVNWAMLYWLAGPEVALRWLVNSTPLAPLIWQTQSPIPLGISYFREATPPGTPNYQIPPQWAEAYHRIAMVRRRDGRVRYAAWERPIEVVIDLREFADLLGSSSGLMMPVSTGL